MSTLAFPTISRAIADGLTRARAPIAIAMRADRDEAGVVAALHAACFADREGRGWSKAEIEALLDDETVSIWLVRREGRPNERPRAFLILRRVPGAEAEIISIGTHPRRRREGAGAMLMRLALRECHGDRIEHLFLEVDAANEAAVSLYRRFGFETVGERKAYYADGARALVMRRVVG